MDVPRGRENTLRSCCDHLAAERGWYDLATTHLDSLASVLRSEMVARVPEQRRSSTWSRMRFSYYTRDARNRDYSVIWRESRNDFARTTRIPLPSDASDDDFAGSPAPQPEVVLDVNALDAGTGYLDLGLSIVSPDENLLAYSLDTSGDEVFTLRFRDLRTGADLPDVVEGTGYTGAWVSDSMAALASSTPSSTRRGARSGSACTGSALPPREDVDVLVEPDRRFEVTVRRCRSEQAIVVLSREPRHRGELVRRPDRRRPRAALARRPAGRGVSTAPSTSGPPMARRWPGRFLLVTNDDAVEFRLVSCPMPGPGGQDHTTWREARPEDPQERLERVDAFEGYVVTRLRRDGDLQLRLLAVDDLAGAGTVVTSRFTGGELALARNTWYDADAVAVTDEALTEPPVHALVSLSDGSVTDTHRDEAPGHDPASYVTQVRSFPAPDGTLVPATIVRHRDTPLDGTAPAVLFGYGAYESVWEREWEEPLPSLLDRGVVYAFTHIRGGPEGGRRWWLDGRLTAKQHTFDDHIAVADGLAAAGPGRSRPHRDERAQCRRPARGSSLQPTS